VYHYHHSKKTPPSSHPHHPNSTTRRASPPTASSEAAAPLWFEKPINSPTDASNHSDHQYPRPISGSYPDGILRVAVGGDEERPNTATRNVAARAEARRSKSKGTTPDTSKPTSRSQQRGGRIKFGGNGENRGSSNDGNNNNGGKDNLLSDNGRFDELFMSKTMGATTLPSNGGNASSTSGGRGEDEEVLSSSSAVGRKKSRRKSNEMYEGDVSKYSREGKEGKTFSIAGCDARMLTTFHRLDIDGHGEVNALFLYAFFQLFLE
jgi:hypothetical protein